MTRIRIIDKGLKRITRRAREGRIATKVMRVVADALIDEIQEGWTQVGPSRPGEPPAVVTATLRSSIRKEKQREGYWQVTANTDYARALELGYPPRNLAQRPYFTPAALRVGVKLNRIVGPVLKDELRGR